MIGSFTNPVKNVKINLQPSDSVKYVVHDLTNADVIELSKVSEEHLLLTVKIKGEIIFSLRSNFRDKLTGAFEELLVYMRNKHIYKYCILELSIDL